MYRRRVHTRIPRSFRIVNKMGKFEDNLTLGQVLISAASRIPSDDALVFPDVKLSYGELLSRSRSWAKVFTALGVKKGDNIGILMTSQPEFVEALFGAAMIGAASVPINARYAPAELSYLVENADLVSLITTDKVADSVDFIKRLNAAFPDLKSQENNQDLCLKKAPKLRSIIVTGSGSHKGTIAESNANLLAKNITDNDLDKKISDVAPEDLALILYTSGTTSNPKGCMIKHKAMVSNSRALGRHRYEMVEGDRFWSPLPIFHIAGILPLVGAFDVGGAYLTIRHFEPSQALKMLETATLAYPCFITILQDLINHPDFTTTDLTNIRIMNSNLGMLPEKIKKTILDAMPNTIHVGTYGLSEASGTVTTSRVNDPLELRTTKLGVPLPGWELKLLDLETGKEVNTGQHGDICIRGPGLLSGYYKDPEKTASSIDKDGWLHTGDIGSLDKHGQLMFHGRSKDMLKVGGENVAAAEIEAILNSHPAIELSQVVGAPDIRYVEVAAAFIKCVNGKNLLPEDIIKYCQGKLARFKIPHHIRFVDDWPMSTSKIQKFKLKEKISIELQTDNKGE
jgi:fatty-acyl-CoA synthase